MNAEEIKKKMLDWQRMSIPTTTLGELLEVFRWFRGFDNEPLLKSGAIERAIIVVRLLARHEHFFVEFVNHVPEQSRRFVAMLHDDEIIGVSGYVEERPAPSPPTDLITLLSRSGGER